MARVLAHGLVGWTVRPFNRVGPLRTRSAATSRLLAMKTIVLQNVRKKVPLRLADFYPMAGIVGIATYVFFKSFLE